MIFGFGSYIAKAQIERRPDTKNTDQATQHSSSRKRKDCEYLACIFCRFLAKSKAGVGTQGCGEVSQSPAFGVAPGLL